MGFSVVRRICSSALPVGAGALLAGVMACSDATGPDERLASARSKWSSAAPSAYSMTIGRACFCVQEVPSPVVVTVRSGVIESRHYTTTGAPVSPTYAEDFPDVEGLFDVIEHALGDAHSVTVTYHATLGYPQQVYIDYIKNAVDDELGFTVNDLITQ